MQTVGNTWAYESTRWTCRLPASPPYSTLKMVQLRVTPPGTCRGLAFDAAKPVQAYTRLSFVAQHISHDPLARHYGFCTAAAK